MTDVILDYILQFPEEKQRIMLEIKVVIEEILPDATARIAWRMATYAVDKRDIIHFAAYKGWVSLSIGIDTMSYFRERLAAYTCTKSWFRLDFNAEVPIELIRDICVYNLIIGEDRNV